MANLTYTEKEAIENVLNMGGGHVSDFSKMQFARFMLSPNKIQIYSDRYGVYGNSKACRLRSFLDLENDYVVGKILKDLIEREYRKKPSEKKTDYDIAYSTVNRLLGLPNRRIEDVVFVANNEGIKPKTDEELFLEKEFRNLSFSKVPIDSQVTLLLEARMKEIQVCIKGRAHLASIILMGSALEGLLLGIASGKVKAFNLARLSPKDKNGKVFPIYNWKLANLIDVANELKIIGNDVRQYSHALRDFRNYIHPHHQMAARFTPDEHTVKISWQVLRAAIDDLSKHESE